MLRMALYPLKFEPIYKAKVWGGRTLEKLGRTLPPNQAIGESWEIADLASTSPSGGGGEAARSVVSNGIHAGLTLHDLIEQFGRELMGDVPLSPEGGFAVLVKFLDARENLSVQVHPDRRYVRLHPEAHLKHEAWYIVDAEPGAVIYKGIEMGTTPEQLRQAIASNTLESLMLKVPVKPGDCHYLPSGTCHALGGGILVAEVQTPSDTTFRLFDWGRTGRELHIEQAIECTRLGPPNVKTEEMRTRVPGPHALAERLVQCDHFRIERVSIADSLDHPIIHNGQMHIWIVLHGSGEITTRLGGDDKVPFEAGQTLLLPANMTQPHVYFNEKTTLLDVSFPQATANLIA
jgi:mannose-6-phosphate isomerase